MKPPKPPSSINSSGRCPVAPATPTQNLQDPRRQCVDNLGLLSQGLQRENLLNGRTCESQARAKRIGLILLFLFPALTVLVYRGTTLTVAERARAPIIELR